MTDLVSDAPVAQSPKRKFSFRFPNLSSHTDRDANRNGEATASGACSSNSAAQRNRNFSEELYNVPDLQVCSFWILIQHWFRVLFVCIFPIWRLLVLYASQLGLVRRDLFSSSGSKMKLGQEIDK